MQALFTKAKSYIPGSGTSTPTVPAAILPDADPSALCTACATCTSLTYPRAFEKIGIDTSERMWNGPSAWDVHLVVATGQDDWIRDVEEIEGSLMQAAAKAVGAGGAGGRKLKISASNMPVESEGDEGATVVVLPSFQVLEKVKVEQMKEVVRVFVKEGVTTTTPLDPAIPMPEQSSIPESLPEPKPLPHDFVILLCSHKRRDARCGISAPILRKEFEKHLRPRGLYRDLNDTRPGGVGIYFINHVGGHKFAGNVIIYGKRGAWCLWYGRIAPMHVKSIVEQTIVEGKCIDRELIRAGFNREAGITSW